MPEQPTPLDPTSPAGQAASQEAVNVRSRAGVIRGKESEFARAFSSYKKELTGLSKRLDKAIGTVEDVTETFTSEVAGSLSKTFLGPFSELIAGFTGIDIGKKIGKTVSGVIGNIREKIFPKAWSKSGGVPSKYSNPLVAQADTAKATTKSADLLSKIYQGELLDRKGKLLALKKKGDEITTPSKGWFANLAKSIGPMLPMILKAAGAAAFTGLLIYDFVKYGLKKFKAGDWVGGIIDTLLGGEAKRDTDVGKNMLKQAAKWGALGFTIGGPLGLAIGAGVGALAAGVKGAIELEWDKQVEKTGVQIREVWSDKKKGLGQKLLGTLGYAGKGLLGIIAGGLMDTVDMWKKSGARLKKVWADPKRSGLSKIGYTIAEVGQSLLSTYLVYSAGIIKRTVQLFKGIAKPVIDKAKKFGQEKLVPFIKSVVETADLAMYNMASKVGLGDQYLKVRKSMINLTENLSKVVVGFVKDVQEKGLVGAIDDLQLTQKIKKIGLKLVGGLGLAGKGLLSVLAGGVNDSINHWKKLIPRLAKVWADPKRSGLSKIAYSVADIGWTLLSTYFVYTGGILKKSAQLFKGIMKPVIDKVSKWGKESFVPFIKNVVGQADLALYKMASKIGLGDQYLKVRQGVINLTKNITDSVSGFIKDVQEKGLIGAIDNLPLIQSIKGFGKTVADGVGKFFENIKESQLGKWFAEKLPILAERTKKFATSVADQLGKFFDMISETTLGKWLSEKIEDVTSSIKGFFGKAAGAIRRFFGGDREKASEDLIQETLAEARSIWSSFKKTEPNLLKSSLASSVIVDKAVEKMSDKIKEFNVNAGDLTKQLIEVLNKEMVAERIKAPTSKVNIEQTSNKMVFSGGSASFPTVSSLAVAK